MSFRRPYWVETSYAVCPRCGAMAEAAKNEGKTLAVRCVKCSLMPTQISVWDMQRKFQIYMMPLFSCRLEEMLDWVAKGWRRECQIWEGDVMVAHWRPGTRQTIYFHGRCGE